MDEQREQPNEERPQKRAEDERKDELADAELEQASGGMESASFNYAKIKIES